MKIFENFSKLFLKAREKVLLKKDYFGWKTQKGFQIDADLMALSTNQSACSQHQFKTSIQPTTSFSKRVLSVLHPSLIDSFLFIRCIETFSSTGEKIGRQKTMISRVISYCTFF